jgi:hypothetical protein
MRTSPKWRNAADLLFNFRESVLSFFQNKTPHSCEPWQREIDWPFF